jgi:hypothetical protein
MNFKGCPQGVNKINEEWNHSPKPNDHVFGNEIKTIIQNSIFLI